MATWWCRLQSLFGWGLTALEARICLHSIIVCLQIYLPVSTFEGLFGMIDIACVCNMNLTGGRWWRWRGFGSPRDVSHLSLLEVSKLVSGCRVNCLVCLHESRAGLLRWRSATVSNFAQLWLITQRRQRQCTQLIFSELKVWHSRCHMSFLQIRVYVRVRPLNSKEDRFLKQQYSYHGLLNRIVTSWSSKYILLSSEDLAHVRDSIAVDTVLGTVGGQDMNIRAPHRGGWGIDSDRPVRKVQTCWVFVFETWRQGALCRAA